MMSFRHLLLPLVLLVCTGHLAAENHNPCVVTDVFCVSSATIDSVTVEPDGTAWCNGDPDTPPAFVVDAIGTTDGEEGDNCEDTWTYTASVEIVTGDMEIEEQGDGSTKMSVEFTIIPGDEGYCTTGEATATAVGYAHPWTCSEEDYADVELPDDAPTEFCVGDEHDFEASVDTSGYAMEECLGDLREITTVYYWVTPSIQSAQTDEPGTRDVTFEIEHAYCMTGTASVTHSYTVYDYEPDPKATVVLELASPDAGGLRFCAGDSIDIVVVATEADGTAICTNGDGESLGERSLSPEYEWATEKTFSGTASVGMEAPTFTIVNLNTETTEFPEGASYTPEIEVFPWRLEKHAEVWLQAQGAGDGEYDFAFCVGEKGQVGVSPGSEEGEEICDELGRTRPVEPSVHWPELSREVDTSQPGSGEITFHVETGAKTRLRGGTRTTFTYVVHPWAVAEGDEAVATLEVPASGQLQEFCAGETVAFGGSVATSPGQETCLDRGARPFPAAWEWVSPEEGVFRVEDAAATGGIVDVTFGITTDDSGTRLEGTPAVVQYIVHPWTWDDPATPTVEDGRPVVGLSEPVGAPRVVCVGDDLSITPELDTVDGTRWCQDREETVPPEYEIQPGLTQAVDTSAPGEQTLTWTIILSGDTRVLNEDNTFSMTVRVESWTMTRRPVIRLDAPDHEDTVFCAGDGGTLMAGIVVLQEGAEVCAGRTRPVDPGVEWIQGPTYTIPEDLPPGRYSYEFIIQTPEHTVVAGGNSLRVHYQVRPYRCVPPGPAFRVDTVLAPEWIPPNEERVFSIEIDEYRLPMRRCWPGQEPVPDEPFDWLITWTADGAIPESGAGRSARVRPQEGAHRVVVDWRIEPYRDEDNDGVCPPPGWQRHVISAPVGYGPPEPPRVDVTMTPDLLAGGQTVPVELVLFRQGFQPDSLSEFEVDFHPRLGTGPVPELVPRYEVTADGERRLPDWAAAAHPPQTAVVHFDCHIPVGCAGEFGVSIRAVTSSGQPLQIVDQGVLTVAGGLMETVFTPTGRVERQIEYIPYDRGTPLILLDDGGTRIDPAQGLVHLSGRVISPLDEVEHGGPDEPPTGAGPAVLGLDDPPTGPATKAAATAEEEIPSRVLVRIGGAEVLPDDYGRFRVSVPWNGPPQVITASAYNIFGGWARDQVVIGYEDEEQGGGLVIRDQDHQSGRVSTCRIDFGRQDAVLEDLREAGPLRIAVTDRAGRERRSIALQVAREGDHWLSQPLVIARPGTFIDEEHLAATTALLLLDDLDDEVVVSAGEERFFIGRLSGVALRLEGVPSRGIVYTELSEERLRHTVTLRGRARNLHPDIDRLQVVHYSDRLDASRPVPLDLPDLPLALPRGLASIPVDFGRTDLTPGHNLLRITARARHATDDLSFSTTSWKPYLHDRAHSFYLSRSAVDPDDDLIRMRLDPEASAAEIDRAFAENDVFPMAYEEVPGDLTGKPQRIVWLQTDHGDLDIAVDRLVNDPVHLFFEELPEETQFLVPRLRDGRYDSMLPRRAAKGRYFTQVLRQARIEYYDNWCDKLEETIEPGDPAHEILVVDARVRDTNFDHHLFALSTLEAGKTRKPFEQIQEEDPTYYFIDDEDEPSYGIWQCTYKGYDRGNHASGDNPLRGVDHPPRVRYRQELRGQGAAGLSGLIDADTKGVILIFLGFNNTSKALGHADGEDHAVVRELSGPLGVFGTKEVRHANPMTLLFPNSQTLYHRRLSERGVDPEDYLVLHVYWTGDYEWGDLLGSSIWFNWDMALAHHAGNAVIASLLRDIVDAKDRVDPVPGNGVIDDADFAITLHGNSLGNRVAVSAISGLEYLDVRFVIEPDPLTGELRSESYPRTRYIAGHPALRRRDLGNELIGRTQELRGAPETQLRWPASPLQEEIRGTSLHPLAPALPGNNPGDPADRREGTLMFYGTEDKPGLAFRHAQAALRYLSPEGEDMLGRVGLPASYEAGTARSLVRAYHANATNIYRDTYHVTLFGWLLPGQQYPSRTTFKYNAADTKIGMAIANWASMSRIRTIHANQIDPIWRALARYVIDGRMPSVVDHDVEE